MVEPSPQEFPIINMDPAGNDLFLTVHARIPQQNCPLLAKSQCTLVSLLLLLLTLAGSRLSPLPCSLLLLLLLLLPSLP